MLDLAERFVTRNIRKEVVIGKTGMYRQEVPEAPAEAIREALANALCHRDYTTGTSAQINAFKDFVEIVSPGLFPEGDTPEKHLSGESDEFHPRNPLFAEALYKAGVIEQYGTGIPRIRETCEAADVTLKPKQTTNSTVVRFDLPGGREAINNSGDKPRTDNKQAVAMKIAAEQDKVTTKMLADSLGIGRLTASRTLQKLAAANMLEWVGKSPNDPHQFYRIKKDSPEE